MTLTILEWPHPILAAIAAPVLDGQMAHARAMSGRMIDIVNHFRAFGLAAPQVGMSCRMFVAQHPSMRRAEVYINPAIVKFGEVDVMLPEGCLSLPGEVNSVSRPAVVDVEYTTFDGARVARKLQGWESRIFQHELDHLDGKMFFEHWTPTARKKFLKRMGVKP